MRTIKILLILGFILTIASCEQSLETTLENGNWTIASIKANKAVDLNMDGNKSIDIKSQNPKCMSDDIFILKVNNELILDDSEISCEDPKLKKGKWEIDGSNLILTLPKTAPITFKVVDYSENKVISKTSFPVGNEDVEFTYTFVSK